jgi:hypothetical protein
MYVDAYLIPVKTSEEIVDALKDYRMRRKNSTTHTYEMKTSKGKYDITKILYNHININDTVFIERSLISSAPRKVLSPKDEYVYIYEIGFIRARIGYIFLPLVLIGIISLLIFYKKIDYLPGRANLTYALLISATILFLFHLNISFHF